MRMRRAQQLEVQQTRRRDIERVSRAAADDGRTRRRRHAASASAPGFGLLDLAHAANGVLDRAIAVQRQRLPFIASGEVLPLGLI